MLRKRGQWRLESKKVKEIPEGKCSFFRKQPLTRYSRVRHTRTLGLVPFLWKQAGGGRVASPGSIVRARTAGPGHPCALEHSVAWAEEWLCDFSFRERSWTDTPGSTGGGGRFPFMKSGILKMFNPSFSNLKHTSYSKSRLYSGVQDILSCFVFLQIFAMVSITPCYSSLSGLSLTGSSVAGAVKVTPQGSPSDVFLFSQYVQPLISLSFPCSPKAW